MNNCETVMSFQSPRAALTFALGLLETVGRSLCPHDESDLAVTLITAQQILRSVELRMIADERSAAGAATV